MIMTQEQAILKAKDQLAQMEQYIRQAGRHGEQVHQVEEGLWKRIMKLGRLMLTAYVADQGTGDLGPTLAYKDRQLNRLDKRHPKIYKSVFGELPPIERTVYGSRETQKHEVIPLDARLGLPESEFSYLLQKWCQSKCVKESYKNAKVDIEEILPISPSILALEDMNQSMAEDVEGFHKSESVPIDNHPICVITADCKGVRIRKDKPPEKDDARHARKRGPRPGNKREACVGGVYTIDRFVRSVDDVMDETLRKKNKANRPVPQNKQLRAELTHRIDGVDSNGKDRVFDWFADQLKMRDVDQLKEIVCVMDGEVCLWNKLNALKKKLKIPIIPILDIYHVIEYLWEAGWSFYGNEPKLVEAFVTERTRRILEGGVGRVIGGLRQMATKGDFNKAQRKTFHKVITYLQNHRHLMHYDTYLAKGYPIGSGVVEGACGYVVKDRMEGTGMRWRIPTAQSMLNLRCVYLNDEWNDFQHYRIKNRVRNMYPYRNLVQQKYREAG